MGPRRLVRPIAPADLLPGDGLVYRGRHAGGKRVAIGHCCLVIARPLILTCFADVTIMECQASSSPAVRRRGGGLWDRKGGIGIRRRPAR